MTIEQILGLSAAELEKMSDEELIKTFEPCLKFTMPSKEFKISSKPTKKSLKEELELFKNLLGDDNDDAL